MKKTGLKIMAGLLFLLFMYGCASRKEIVQFKNDMQFLREQVQLIRNENREIKQKLQEIDRSIAAIEQDNNRTKADMMAEIADLKQQSRSLDNKLEDNIQQMSRLMLRAEPEVSQPNPSDSLEDVVSGKEPANAMRSGNRLDPKQLYDNAYLDLSRGNYPLALQGFQEYVQKFPNSELADNAQYWIGETYYAQGNYRAALTEFNKVLQEYPEGNKKAAAVLKIGFCYVKLGDMNNGKKYLNEVIQRFPDSEEAKVAKSMLLSQ